VPEEDSSIQEKIPISLSADVYISHTRTIGSYFEPNDAIGLYIMMQSFSSLENVCYADNVKFTNSVSNNFISEKPLFYPEGGEMCDFLAYYPYNDNKIIEAGSALKVAVQTNQSNIGAFSASDFLVAKSSNISASEKPVHLAFHHKMSCLNIRLLPGQGYTAEKLLKTNPIVRISDMYTNASYNISSDQFSGYNTPTDIIPNGTWKIDNNGVLVGKSAIVIPQIIFASTVLIELEIDGVFFDCTLDENFSFESESFNEFTLTVSSNHGGVQTSISTDIYDWEEVQKKDIETTSVPSYVSILNLTFPESSIYRLMAGDGSFVGEICREYLYADNINSRAVVIYPVKEGKTELTNGFVALVEGSENMNVHGGKVSWGTDGCLTYTAGASAPVNYIYMTPEGEIVTSRDENVLQLECYPYVLTDTRQAEICTYPIVKIGQQYWMGENLRASKYTNGVDILLTENYRDSLLGLYCIQEGAFFYNLEAVSTGILPPSGWKIADDNAWEMLKTYVRGDTSVLKSELGWKKENYQKANFTGFNAIASGLYNERYEYKGEYAIFWSMSNFRPNEASKSIVIGYNTNLLNDGLNAGALGLSVRCIKL
jgi:uncharacterized protein (TIGR02145 family)